MPTVEKLEQLLEAVAPLSRTYRRYLSPKPLFGTRPRSPPRFP